jgi:DNA invertase Pin-like site-specific DNA recombinase
LYGGIEKQEQMLQPYAEHRGFLLTSIYTDLGMSGATLERAALQGLIADCRAGEDRHDHDSKMPTGSAVTSAS